MPIHNYYLTSYLYNMSSMAYYYMQSDYMMNLHNILHLLYYSYLLTHYYIFMVHMQLDFHFLMDNTIHMDTYLV